MAVIAELKKQSPGVEIRFWCDQVFFAEANATMGSSHPDVVVDTIAAGKFRRYHGIPLWRQLIQLRTIVLPNLFDGLKITWGILQSFYKLLRWRPDVVFTKGGYVCLPVGLAARVLKIPLVIHDSDAHPGLTNRILARWASVIATGAPLDNYPYPRTKSHFVGIPLSDKLAPATSDEQCAYKRSLGFEAESPLVVATGGGLGAKRLNEAIIHIAPELIVKTSLLLVAGKSNYDDLIQYCADIDQTKFRVLPFVPMEKFADVLKAADIVISRAGATAMLELAALAKPTILLPNKNLTGGHQLKNAKVYADADAAIILDDEAVSASPQILKNAISALLDDKTRLDHLSNAISQFALPNASRDVAALVIAARKR